LNCDLIEESENSNTGMITILEKVHEMVVSHLTRGPRGPWVAHLRKRSQATVEAIIENPRGII